MRTAERRVFLSFAAIGVAILAVTAYLALETGHFIQNAAVADGTVIENVWSRSGKGRATHPRVRFRSESGREFTFVSSAGSNPPSYRPGEHVEVLYDRADPSHARIHSFFTLWIFPLFLGIMGAFFSLFGAGRLAWQRHVDRRDAWLRANGRSIQATFDRVETIRSNRRNIPPSWRIVCHWRDPISDRIHVFRSHKLWSNPAPQIKGKTVDVMVDPSSPRRYVVEPPLPVSSTFR